MRYFIIKRLYFYNDDNYDYIKDQYVEWDNAIDAVNDFNDECKCAVKDIKRNVYKNVDCIMIGLETRYNDKSVMIKFFVDEKESWLA